MMSNPMIRKLGISFSPCGFLTPFHLGVASELRDLKLLLPSTVLAGASGGALAAVGAALDIPHEKGIDACVRVARICDKHGTRKILRKAFDEVVGWLVPVHSHVQVNNRPSPCIVSYRQVTPFQQSVHVHQFESTDDLFDVLRASCNIPFYFNGTLGVPVRKGMGCDGFFANDFHRMGCPRTFAEKELMSVPFKVAARALRSDMKRSSPGKVDIITPLLLSEEEWPFNSFENVYLALKPPSQRMIDKIKYIMGNTVTEKTSEDDNLDDFKIVYSYIFNTGVAATRRWAAANKDFVKSYKP
jgi:hypothetical protein